MILIPVPSPTVEDIFKKQRQQDEGGGDLEIIYCKCTNPHCNFNIKKYNLSYNSVLFSTFVWLWLDPLNILELPYYTVMTMMMKSQTIWKCIGCEFIQFVPSHVRFVLCPTCKVMMAEV